MHNIAILIEFLVGDWIMEASNKEVIMIIDAIIDSPFLSEPDYQPRDCNMPWLRRLDSLKVQALAPLGLSRGDPNIQMLWVPSPFLEVTSIVIWWGTGKAINLYKFGKSRDQVLDDSHITILPSTLLLCNLGCVFVLCIHTCFKIFSAATSLTAKWLVGFETIDSLDLKDHPAYMGCHDLNHNGVYYICINICFVLLS